MIVARAALVAAILAVAHGALAQGAADLPASGSGYELRIGGIYAAADHNSFFAGTARAASGTVLGGEVHGRVGLFGLTVRNFDGKFGNQPEVVNADVSLLVGPPVFQVVGGLAERAIAGELATQVYRFARVGALSTIRIGGSPLRATLAGVQYLPVGADKQRVQSGTEGETSVLYTPGGGNVYFQFSYRVELFTAKLSSGSMLDTAPEELRELRLGVGLQFGGR